MKRLTTVLVVLAVAATSVFAGGQQEGKEGLQGNFSMGGSTTVEPILRAAIEEFAEIHPGARLGYEAQGSSVGVKGVLSGIYVLGGASRDLKSSEVEKGAKAKAIALDGIALVVHGDVAVDSLSRADVAKIYTGEITNWSQVGGPDQDIVVANRDEASGTRGAFKELVLEEEMGDNAEFLMDTIIVESNGDMVTKVGSTPASIGYCGFGYLDQARNAGAKSLLIGGVAPEVNSVLDGTYKISRKLNMVYTGDIEEGSFKDIFIKYLLSDAGQTIVADEGFIALP